MLRTIEYIFSAEGISPHSPQFAGVQGENGATQLTFTPDDDFAEVLAALRETYDTVYYRFDWVDGADRTVTGEVTEYESGAVSTTLSTEQTAAGGKLRVCLVFSGENNEIETGVCLFSFPVTLYFKEFPLRMNATERGDLNHAVAQVKALRDEAYEMLSDSEDCNAQTQTLLQQMTTYQTQISGSVQSAASYASTALTNAVTASGHAAQAGQSAAEAVAALNELRSTAGGINEILATLVDVA